MEKVALGRSGLQVSPISLGTWQLSGITDERTATATIERARELGVNLFETAPASDFGESEQLLRDALDDEIHEHRDDLVLATEGGLRREGDIVVPDASPATLRAQVDDSRRVLGVDALDLFQVIWPDPSTPFDETTDELFALVDAGKIKHAGVSSFGPDPIELAFAQGLLETLQTPYYMFGHGLEGMWLPYARTHDLGVLIGGPLTDAALAHELGTSGLLAPPQWRTPSSEAAGRGRRLAMRRPAKGGTTRPLTLRPEYGFGRPRHPNPDRLLQRNVAAMDGLQRFAASRQVSVAQLVVAWTLANPTVNVAIVGAGSPGQLQDTVGAVDLRLSGEDLAAIDRILERSDRAA